MDFDTDDEKKLKKQFARDEALFIFDNHAIKAQVERLVSIIELQPKKLKPKIYIYYENLKIYPRLITPIKHLRKICKISKRGEQLLYQ